MRVGRLLLIAGLMFALIAASALLIPSQLSARGSAPASSSSTAPPFNLTTIFGGTFELTRYRGSSVVMIEFTSLSCSECQIVEKSMASLYSGYNASGSTDVQVLSVYIEPSFGDTVPALKAYHQKNNITWFMAQDTPSLAVSSAYGVLDIPDVFIVDKKGSIVYDQTGAQDQSTLATKVSQALQGTAPAIALVTVSVFVLAAIAGVSTFFSPCAFPMFPGYMSLFLGLNAPGASGGSPSGPTYKGAARRAVLAGGATAFGMILIFLAVGVALILAASAVSGYIPDLLVVVGAILIGLGALLLTNLQYWRIVTPLQNLWRRMRGASQEPAPITSASAQGDRLYLKLFGYGMGYAAAAAGCVFPVIFSAIVAGLALGLVGGLVTILIYSATAAVLMIVVTVLLAVASRRFVNQLKAFTPVIKKISAVALILVGVYLIYFYYAAWISGTGTPLGTGIGL